uniref:Uncharacterized protein n=1 Tax=Rhizophora mucronata TaxID=61149 RepID=A0A2P2NML4_RHIMU
MVISLIVDLIYHIGQFIFRSLYKCDLNYVCTICEETVPPRIQITYYTPNLSIDGPCQCYACDRHLAIHSWDI